MKIDHVAVFAWIFAVRNGTRHATAQSTISCPATADAAPIEVIPGIDATFARADIEHLCTLVKVTADGKSIAPVGRSYGGHPWEASAGAFASIDFSCGVASSTFPCSVTIPNVTQPGETYFLTTFQYSPPSSVDEVARFLEQATFGPTRADLQAFNITKGTSLGIAEWVKKHIDDLPTSATSHREWFRARANPRYDESTSIGRPTHPCEADTRWRKFAFAAKDYRKMLRVDEVVNVNNSNATQLTLSIDGHVRTVVDALEWSSTYGAVPPGSEYEICTRPSECLGCTFRLRTSSGSCQNTYYDDDIYGTPPVTFDGGVAAPTILLDLSPSSVQVVDEKYFPEGTAQELILSTDLFDPACADIPLTGTDTTPVFGMFSGSYYVHDPRLVLEENTVHYPNPDGGGGVNDLTSDTVKCANAPRTFLNEAQCQLTTEPNVCGQVELPPELVLRLDHNTMRTIYAATGAGGLNTMGNDATRYLYVIEGLRIDADSGTDPPCLPGARSRWVQLPSSVASPPCAGVIPAALSNETRAALSNMIETSDDTNPNVRDVIFPPSSGAACSAGDGILPGFDLEVEGVCWRNVHQDHLQVFDMTYWTYQGTHPGNSVIRNPIKEFAEAGNTTLVFPGWHQMWRWRDNRLHFGELGRFGDYVKFRDLPEGLRTDTIARAFGAAGAVTSVIVCGSPGEVANDPGLGGSEGRGGFDVAQYGTRTTFSSEYYMQRKIVWTMVALQAKDQLRQRMAWALSQILVISATAITANINTEIFLVYYDIFVRHAFGNYRDILKEVSYSPMMAEMLSYYQSRSTAYMWEQYTQVAYADENYAREVMQLFTTGLYKLKPDGTQAMENGQSVRVYNNEDIQEYARAWTCFDRQPKRGNIEDYTSGTNRLDPMHCVAEWRDRMPKMGLNRAYVGDKYPLCADIPSQQFLRKGSKYRLLGISSMPELQYDPPAWADDPNVVTFDLSPQSQLYAKLCDGNDTVCNFPNQAVLDSNLECSGLECDVDTVRVVQVVRGVFYEYIRPPCVEQAFFANAKKVVRLWWDKMMCADPRRDVAATACCTAGTNQALRDEKFYGERMTYGTAEQRCSGLSGYELCDANPLFYVWNDCIDNGGCDNNGHYWTTASCKQKAKIDPNGRVAIVHDPGTDPNRIMKHVQADTKTFFRADWSGDSYPTASNGCGSISGASLSSCEAVDGMCICDLSVNETQVYFNETPGRHDALETLHIGAFNPAILDANYSSFTENGITVHSDASFAGFTSETIFEVKDDFGVVHFLKNIRSVVHIDGSSYSFRNAPHFLSLVDEEERDAHFETDAVLDHYFYHENTAPFLAIRFAQRFGISNPSPRYVKTIAAAFRSGEYVWVDDATGESISFGSGRYGDLAATLSSVLLDRESRSVLLDADPAHGSFKEPLLKIVGFMRSMEFVADDDKPFIELVKMEEIIGQMSHEIPTVFSFFLPEYQPSGPVAKASLVAPEAQELTGPNIIGTVNGLFSLIKWGLNSCWNGFGTNRGGTCYRAPGDYSSAVGKLTYEPSSNSSGSAINELSTLLTGGRLSPEKKQILQQVYSSATDTSLALMKAQQLITSTAEFHSTGIARESGEPQEPSPLPAASPEPYKAVVYVFLSGGYDSYNMLVPHSCTGVNAQNETVHDQYNNVRQGIALTENERIPINATSSNQPCEIFALHHNLGVFNSTYNDGDTLFIVNAGVINKPVDKYNYSSVTKTQLFSHNTMEEETKRVDPFLRAPGTGVLGRMTGALTRLRGPVQNSTLKPGSISIQSASIAVVGEPAQSPTPIIVSKYGATSFDPYPNWPTLRSEVEALNNATNLQSSVFGKMWSTDFLTAIAQSDALVEALDTAAITEDFRDENNAVTDEGQKLEVVARLINTHNLRGTDRDVFYVEFSSWDHHSNLKSNLASRFQRVNEALQDFVNELKAQNQWNNVAIVTASEFARTLTTNSGEGSDHAWGGHYAVMGGRVKGGRILGEYPSDITDGSPLNVSPRGIIIPTTSWDAIWNGVSQWMGVKDGDDAYMDEVLPNRLECCGSPPKLFSETDLFEPAPVGGSCMSGNTGVLKQFLNSRNSMEVVPTKVKDLKVGDKIRGLNEDKEEIECNVEAIGTFGQGTLYGNYTSDHFVVDATGDRVHEHGPFGDEVLEAKYELMTSCPVGIDESGTYFTPIDSDFCGVGTTDMSWSDYLVLHSSILSVVRKTGGYWFSGSSYESMDVVSKYAPAVCAAMLRCARNPRTCNSFEAASRKFVDKALKADARGATERAFSNLGRWTESGSVSDLVSRGKSVRLKDREGDGKGNGKDEARDDVSG